MKLAKILTLCMLFFSSCASIGNRVPSSYVDPPATHGMLLFGEKMIYASHLPMFHRPHDYQGIFQIEFSASGLEAYKNSHRDYPQILVYTLVPKPFSLPQLAQNPFSFSAQIYRGHFERGGTLIANDVTVNVSRVVYFQKFDPSATHPSRLTYLFFGNEKEQFAAHLISAAPDFDQVVQIDRSQISQLSN